MACCWVYKIRGVMWLAGYVGTPVPLWFHRILSFVDQVGRYPGSGTRWLACSLCVDMRQGCVKWSRCAPRPHITFYDLCISYGFPMVSHENLHWITFFLATSVEEPVVSFKPFWMTALGGAAKSPRVGRGFRGPRGQRSSGGWSTRSGHCHVKIR